MTLTILRASTSSKGTAPSSSTGRQSLSLRFLFLRALRMRRRRARRGRSSRPARVQLLALYGHVQLNSLNTHASANVPKSAKPNTDLHPRLATSTVSSASPNTAPPHQPQSQPQAQGHLPTALLWSELQPWMDAEYARQVCALMRVPPPGFSVDNPNNFPFTYINGPTSLYTKGYNGGGYSNGGQQNGWHGRAANNGGCCILTFGSVAAAAAALAQVNSTSTPGTKPFTGLDIICVSAIACRGGMLYSAKPFTGLDIICPDIICVSAIACRGGMLYSVKPFTGPNIICYLQQHP
ncbi:hypothetical protein B0H14DRAFT_2598610 [Mycena olivaceomarginata]|nr:hypothetical protein B0H14DRAFT_2598610 [Mycena olivaceomarginata]